MKFKAIIHDDTTHISNMTENIGFDKPHPNIQYKL